MLSRAAAFMAVALAYRLAWRFGGRAAGLVAAFGLCLSADFFVTGLRGYSEPLLIALAFAAIDQHLDGRRLEALALGAAAGLLRPEIWLLTGLYGLYLLVVDGPAARPPGAWRWSAAVVLLVAAAPGDLARARPARLGQRARVERDRADLAARQRGARREPRHHGLRAAPPTPSCCRSSCSRCCRSRSPTGAVSAAVLTMAGAALTWVIVVAVMAEGGFTGRRRYVILAAALMCVLAGIAVGWLAEELHVAAAAASCSPRVGVDPRGVRVLTGAHGLPAAAPRAPAGRPGQRAARRGRAPQEARAPSAGWGGPSSTRTLHTALAWQLDLPLERVTATWSRTSRRDRWHPPAVLFRAPAKLAGPRPALPPGQGVTIARAGRWRVVRVSAPLRPSRRRRRLAVRRRAALQPARHPPRALAEQLHERGQQHEPHDRRVEQHGDRRADAELARVHDRRGGEREEHGGHDERGAGDDPRGLPQAVVGSRRRSSPSARGPRPAGS